MPKHKVRKGFAPTKNKYGGFRDKSGQTFRPGKSVFVLVPYQQWGNLSTGVIPARFFRTFAWAQDKLGAYRLDAEYAWMLNHDMLIELGAFVTAVIPVDIMQEMAADSKKVVETPWPVSDEFETLFSDVSMQGFFSPPPVGPRIDAYTHMGTLNLGITPSGNLKKNKGGFNFATGFKTWTQGDTLESMVPATLKGALPAFDGLQPCSADYGVGAAERMPQQVARGGGPELNDGAELKVGADELEIFGVEYERDGSGDDDPLRDFSTGFAFITSNAYADPLQGVEMLDHKRLAALATNEDTLALLAEPELSKRLFLNNHGELLPGWRQVEFNRTSIVRTILSLNPALLEGATLLHGAEDTFTFECAARAGGALVSLRRCGEKLARTRVAQLAGPSPRALRGVVKTWLQDVLVQKTKAAERNLDPLEFTVPCSYAFVTALACFPAMRRSPTKRNLLTHVRGCARALRALRAPRPRAACCTRHAPRPRAASCASRARTRQQRQAACTDLTLACSAIRRSSRIRRRRTPPLACSAGTRRRARSSTVSSSSSSRCCRRRSRPARRSIRAASRVSRSTSTISSRTTRRRSS